MTMATDRDEEPRAGNVRRQKTRFSLLLTLALRGGGDKRE